MIDTIVLRIEDVSRFRVNNPSIFTPEFKTRELRDLSMEERREGIKKNYLNRFVIKSRKKGGIKPRVEIYEKINKKNFGIIYTLKLEFSVPKLLFGNSLEEISENDFDEIVMILQERLLTLGVYIKRNDLEYSYVSKIHFAKNIILPDEIRMQKILEDLSKSDVGNNKDITRATFTNGEALHLYLGVRDEVFYDKIRDIQKPKNRSKDKSITEEEKSIVDVYNLCNKEVFRYEYRLKNPNNLRSIINKILKRKYESSILFKDVFNQNLWEKVIKQAWRKILKKEGTQVALNFNTKKDKLEIFKDILVSANRKNNNAHSLNKSLISYGLANLLNDYGAPLVIKEFKKIWSDRACGSRFQDKIKEAHELLQDLSLPDEISFIDKKINEFERITTEVLKNHNFEEP